MARKTNDILLLSALILVALATLVQSLAMRDVIANDFESEEYTTPGTIDKSIFEYQRKPYDKAKLDEYYSKYKHVSDDGQTVTLFSREQLADLSEDIKNSKRENLTLDHFFYIVEDSVELYFKYPKIMLCSTYIGGKHEEIDSIYDIDVDSFISGDDEKREFYKYYAQMGIDRIVNFRLNYHDAGKLRLYWGKFDGDIEVVDEAHGKKNYESIIATILDGSLDVDEKYTKKLCAHLSSYLSTFSEENVPIEGDWNEVYARSPVIIFSDEYESYVIFDTVTDDAYHVFPYELLDQKVSEFMEKRVKTTD